MFENIVKHYPDFPKPGIDFIDIMPFLQNKEAFNQLVEELDRHTHCSNVATVDARGFLFASPLLVTSKLVDNIITIRKKGKLPYAEGDLVQVEIEKEYGHDTVYYRLSDIAAGKPEGDSFYVTFFDDILATGGTALGIASSMNGQTIMLDGRSYKVKIKEFLFLVELPDLHGADLLTPIAPVHSLMQIAGA